MIHLALKKSYFSLHENKDLSSISSLILQFSNLLKYLRAISSLSAQLPKWDFSLFSIQSISTIIPHPCCCSLDLTFQPHVFFLSFFMRQSFFRDLFYHLYLIHLHPSPSISQISISHRILVSLCPSPSPSPSSSTPPRTPSSPPPPGSRAGSPEIRQRWHSMVG